MLARTLIRGPSSRISGKTLRNFRIGHHLTLQERDRDRHCSRGFPPSLTPSSRAGGLVCVWEGTKRSRVREISCPGHTAHTLQQPSQPRQTIRGRKLGLHHGLSCGYTGGKQVRGAGLRGKRGDLDEETRTVQREPSGDKSPGLGCRRRSIVSGHKELGARPQCKDLLGIFQ